MVEVVSQFVLLSPCQKKKKSFNHQCAYNVYAVYGHGTYHKRLTMPCGAHTTSGAVMRCGVLFIGGVTISDPWIMENF